MTPQGSMREPEFVFEFRRIEPLQAGAPGEEESTCSWRCWRLRPLGWCWRSRGKFLVTVVRGGDCAERVC
jgi:hypothetical protein